MTILANLIDMDDVCIRVNIKLLLLQRRLNGTLRVEDVVEFFKLKMEC